MQRSEKRKQERVIESIKRKAKLDMEKWFDTLHEEPTINEVIAWKAGYIAGINRVHTNGE